MVEKVITKLDQKHLVLIVVLMNCEPELSYIPAELFNMCLKEFVLYLYKSTIRPCMEYCCHVWAGAPNLFLELLKKNIYRTVGPSLSASLEPLAHRRNVASLSHFYRYYVSRYSSELAQLVPLPYSRGRSILYSDRLHDFSVTISRCYKDVYVNSFFARTARL